MVSFRLVFLPLVCCLALANGAQAFELFGIRFFEKKDAARVDVIDPLDYRVRLRISGPAPKGLRDRINRVSSVLSNAGQPAPGAAGLIARARNDYRPILAGLYEEGYYAGAISIRIGGREAADMQLVERLPQGVLVEITVEPGPPFTFGETRIVNEAPHRDARDSREDLTVLSRFGRGEPARATVIGDVADVEIRQWRRAGHPLAAIGDQALVADHDRRRLDATLVLDPGPAARFGPVTVSGSKSVDPIFLRRMAAIEPGTPYHPDAVARVRDRLNNLGVFNSVRIDEPETVNPDGSYPLEITVRDRKPRRIGFGASFSSVDGLGLEAYWLHRNLLGRAERLRFDAGVSGIAAGDALQEYDYNFGVGFTKPGVITPDTDLVADFSLRQAYLDAYRERSATLSGGFNHRFSADLSGRLEAEFSQVEIEDDGGIEIYSTISLIAAATLDRRDDARDPRRGYYLRGEARPFHEFGSVTTALQTLADARAYVSFGETLDTVLAGRIVAGSIFGGETGEIPTNLLFFSGGGGSVRGYRYRSNGIESGGQTEGGRSLLEISGELRHQFTDTIGAVGFIDAGHVGASTLPGTDGTFRVGAGLGLRYYTGIGPIRLDLAIPLDPKPGDPNLAYYIGIGQAF